MYAGIMLESTGELLTVQDTESDVIDALYDIAEDTGNSAPFINTFDIGQHSITAWEFFEIVLDNSVVIEPIHGYFGSHLLF